MLAALLYTLRAWANDILVDATGVRFSVLEGRCWSPQRREHEIRGPTRAFADGVCGGESRVQRHRHEWRAVHGLYASEFLRVVYGHPVAMG